MDFEHAAMATPAAGYTCTATISGTEETARSKEILEIVITSLQGGSTSLPMG